ncbi:MULTISPECIES: DUF2147 domain-containing protein [unclassified Bradyrhizobium]|uniref:DUF2147 domain-containing protein n=1 Tax=unclassified Bradyrhizobium TaxID=2631580 RepID=UPI001BABE380|nr:MULTISPECIES: DUF2147 domain-containing protein [unclassified Bradyrhizobium]MBR1205902.1 DUF2147 domain-containing protein [Bradyrhizobium sp. AUGA SZCCT0124]MBR1315709.1 DUF2147 domain-containing protein [Bradyrhizobium sp. AUGA SZCCT0051]MBR1338229.1 DUF2147 domain-containing protein [Bradyrhizobium sp. AUGA SZCCT0105]MBR1355884.1 DUF2147 domain-containing protein [Bradyrhizobium sp. AUGA SZCCT0045]
MNYMVRLFLRSLVAAILMSSTGHAEVIASSDPSGTWLTEDGRARIRLERCGTARDRICGFIVWMKDPLDPRGQPFRDSFNPDPDKRTRALLGHQLILGLKLSPEGRFDGDIYNAEDGKSYSVSLWRDASDRLKLRGCLLKLLCQTQTWTQTFDAQPGQLVGLTGDAGGPRADREWASLPAPAKAKSAAK